MNKIMLNNLQLGKSCYIRKIFLEENIKRRLQELGFVDGSIVKCVLKSPLKEPVAYFVKGTMIALREDVTKNILVEII
ncbi:FeoA family protein [uncultured Tyzzerella sp.]|uniref:FeoA family protein n=1 Tax=uncultured Tyzzerella sp. TaxID=2321398 RepID=UPI0029429235|nr:FeoA family protein [uncultured Tyzzerella sp.]